MMDILFWLFLIGILSGGVYLLLCVLWLKKCTQACKTAGDEIRKLERKFQESSLLRRSFDSYHEEPFITSLMDIDHELEAIKGKIHRQKQQYIELRDRLARIKYLRGWDIRKKLNLVMIYRLQKDCIENREQCHLLDSQLEQVKARFDQIKEFPWSIALQTRELMEYLHQAKRLLNELVALGLYGSDYEDLSNRVKGIEEDIQTIPVYFLSEPYDKLIQIAVQEDVRQVYQIVIRDLPQIIEIIQQADRWKNQSLALDHQSKFAQRETERYAQLLIVFPEEIDISAEKTKVEFLSNRLGDLQQRRKKLTVENILSLSSEVSGFIHEIQANRQRLRQARQQYDLFQRFLQLSAELSEQIQKRLDQISTASLTIEWDINGSRFEQAVEEYQALKAIEKPFPMESLKNLAEKASKVQGTLDAINRSTLRIEELHRNCLKIYESPEITSAEQWLESAKKLAEAIRPYEPRNWPNRDWVLTLDKQLQELEKNYLYLNEKLAGKKILESSLDRVYSTLDEVHRQFITLRERVNVIDQVFHNLVNHEKQHLALLKTTRNQFAQITMFVLSQPLLAEKAEKEIVQLDRRFDLIEASFHQRDRDTLSRKQNKLNQLITEVEQAANRWMSVVENDCLKLLNDLEKRFERLDQICHLEDAILYRTRELILRRDEIFNFRRTARVNIPMDQLVPSMKKVFDTWQESFALSKQLAEQVESPLLSLYQEFQTLQRNAQAKYMELQTLIPLQRKWPPNSLMLTVERNEVAQLEEKWNTLQTQPTSVIQFVKALGDMIGGYRSLLEKFAQYEQWAIQEQTRIERIEADIYRLDRLWEIQQRRYAQVPEIEGQIRELRQKAERELSSLRQYWLTNASRRPASVDYDVVLRKLIELSRHLANAKITLVNEVGQQEMMDINGQIILKV